MHPDNAQVVPTRPEPGAAKKGYLRHLNDHNIHFIFGGSVRHQETFALFPLFVCFFPLTPVNVRLSTFCLFLPHNMLTIMLHFIPAKRLLAMNKCDILHSLCDKI